MTATNLSVAEALFGKAQRAVLALLFGQPDRAFYLREVVIAAGTGASQVQKELDNLTRAGLILREPRGNQVWFRANPDAPVFPELKSLVAKTFGIADVVRDARWGRDEECVGEDAYLVGSIVSAYVAGLQGDDLRTGIAQTLQRFTALRDRGWWSSPQVPA